MFETKKVILILCIFFILLLTSCSNLSSKVVGEYDVSKHAVDFGDSEAYAIGANVMGKPVFKNPNEAFEQALKDYKDGFNAIAKEFNLEKINKRNYEQYFKYGWQLTTGTDDAKEQGLIISKFFDIYENSFK